MWAEWAYLWDYGCDGQHTAAEWAARINRARAGEEVVITDKGTPVARLGGLTPRLCWTTYSADAVPTAGLMTVSASWPEAGLPETSTVLSLEGFDEVADRVQTLL